MSRLISVSLARSFGLAGRFVGIAPEGGAGLGGEFRAAAFDEIARFGEAQQRLSGSTRYSAPRHSGSSRRKPLFPLSISLRTTSFSHSTTVGCSSLEWRSRIRH